MFHTFFLLNENNRPNIQKLTYQLLQQRRLERSTNSKNLNCDTEQIGPPSPPNNDRTCDHQQNYFDYDDNLLSPPEEKPEHYFDDAAPQLQSNNHHSASKSSDFCSIKPIYKHHYYNIPIITQHSTTKIRPNIHLSTPHIFAIEPKLQLSLISACQKNELNAKLASATISLTSNLKTFGNKIKSFLFSSYKSKQKRHYRKEKLSTCYTATSEYVAAGKLHYILSQVRIINFYLFNTQSINIMSKHFKGTMNGCMYPDGRVIWSGKLGKITFTL